MIGVQGSVFVGGLLRLPLGQKILAENCVTRGIVLQRGLGVADGLFGEILAAFDKVQLGEICADQRILRRDRDSGLGLFFGIGEAMLAREKISVSDQSGRRFRVERNCFLVILVGVREIL